MRTFPFTLTLLFASLAGMGAETPAVRGSAVGLNKDVEQIRELLKSPPNGELSALKAAILEKSQSPIVGLMQVAADPLNLARVRILSIALLSEFPRPEVKAYLIALAEDPSAHPTFRGWALQSYARGFASTEPDEVRATVGPYLNDLEPGLRTRAEMAMEYVSMQESGNGGDPMAPHISMLLQD